MKVKKIHSSGFFRNEVDTMRLNIIVQRVQNLCPEQGNENCKCFKPLEKKTKNKESAFVNFWMSCYFSAYCRARIIGDIIIGGIDNKEQTHKSFGQKDANCEKCVDIC